MAWKRRATHSCLLCLDRVMMRLRRWTEGWKWDGWRARQLEVHSDMYQCSMAACSRRGHLITESPINPGHLQWREPAGDNPCYPVASIAPPTKL